MQDPTHPPTPPAAEGLDIIGHVANSPPDHPLIHLPPMFGIDLSVSKHVFMLWIVAAIVFVVITAMVRRYVRQPRLVPTGAMNVLEIGVEFIRDGVARPNLGEKWTPIWTPLLLTFFVFILSANVIGLIPIFDVLGLINHYVLHGDEHSFLTRVVHGSSTATGNANVTAGLAVISFFAIIVAGMQGARLHRPLGQSGSEWRPEGDLPAAHPLGNHGHVRSALRADGSTCGQHDGRSHRPSGDHVDRVHCRRGIGCGGLASASAWCSRCR